MSFRYHQMGWSLSELCHASPRPTVRCSRTWHVAAISGVCLDCQYIEQTEVDHRYIWWYMYIYIICICIHTYKVNFIFNRWTWWYHIICFFVACFEFSGSFWNHLLRQIPKKSSPRRSWHQWTSGTFPSRTDFGLNASGMPCALSGWAPRKIRTGHRLRWCGQIGFWADFWCLNRAKDCISLWYHMLINNQ